MRPRTLLQKIWEMHCILSRDGADLLFVDRHFVHEGSHHAFDKIRAAGRCVRHPELTFGVADHYAPSGDIVQDNDIAAMVSRLSQNTARHGIDSFGLDDPRQGIVHVTMPEQGLTLPGTVIVCGDSHTATHGAFGAFAIGIGASEVAHVLATQTIWEKPMTAMKIAVDGTLPIGTFAKDLALFIISKIGTAGATRCAIEYGGEAIRALSMDARMTLCNMTIEMGARAGMVSPDEVTFRWLRNRPLAPRGADWEAAVKVWRALATDEGAIFDQKLSINAADVIPMVTWGTSPQEVAPITGHVPDGEENKLSLEYMGLAGGEPLEGLKVDRVFIGSCTNARYSDLVAAAAVLKGRRVKVPVLVSPGSSAVARRAEETGIAGVFRAAGATWARSSCSLCVGMNGDRVAFGERCASTSNRNFRGRQGPGARTHLMSPVMAAAAAITGYITDARQIGVADIGVQ